MSRGSFSEPTFEESSLQERVTSFYRNYEHADDPVALMRAQRDLDTIVMRCQHDDTLPNPFEFFKGTGDAGEEEELQEQDEVRLYQHTAGAYWQQGDQHDSRKT